MTAKSSKPEKKRKMIDLFEELTTQGFKDAYNPFYNLNPKTSAEGKTTS